METLNLFLDIEFTSLSPDAQPVSLGIVTEDIPARWKSLAGQDVFGRYEFQQYENWEVARTRSFYAEFKDFDLNRCDLWVLDNVVKKLLYYPEVHDKTNEYDLEYWDMCMNAGQVKIKLSKWLSQFSDYQIQFVVDCGTWDWYHFVQLIGIWEEIPTSMVIPMDAIPPNMTLEEFAEEWHKADYGKPIMVVEHPERVSWNHVRTGLPELPKNISPVPMDLNDLIALKKGMSVKEAFDLNREELAGKDGDEKHNALWDAKIIKEIYTKLTSPRSS